MNNFLRILLATIIMPAYLIADEADEPTSPAKPDEVEVKENDEEEVENDSEDSEDKTYLIDNLPALSANDIANTLAWVLGYGVLAESAGGDTDPEPAPTPAPPPARSREQLFSTRSITTIGQQTHHVQILENGDDALATLHPEVLEKLAAERTTPSNGGCGSRKSVLDSLVGTILSQAKSNLTPPRDFDTCHNLHLFFFLCTVHHLLVLPYNDYLQE